MDDGWRCARTTLMNERNTIAGLTLDRIDFIAKKPVQEDVEVSFMAKNKR